MKNFIAGSGGRYVYSEDFENLQALALSINSIFEGCDNFAISGCKVSGTSISSGYVWINRHIRYFEGGANISFPYYIYEKNTSVSTEYKDEPNKTGRVDYLCAGSNAKPVTNDSITGSLPAFIEITASYIPRIHDKFFGKYSMILDHPFVKQTVAKDVDFNGNIISKKNIDANGALSVTNSSGYVIKNIFKPNGDASVGLYLDNSIVSEIVITKSGLIKFFKGSVELASIGEDGLTTNKKYFAESFQTTYLSIVGNSLYNFSDTTDTASVDINKIGYSGGTTKFRNFNVYDGKGSVLLSLSGQNKAATINGAVEISHGGKGASLINAQKGKADVALINTLIFKASDGDIGYIGYNSSTTLDMDLVNSIGDLILKPKASVDVKGTLKVNGKDISQVYVSTTSFTEAMGAKVSAVNGMGLSENSFTTLLKAKLDNIVIADVANNKDGLINLNHVVDLIGKRLLSTNNLSDLTDKAAARTNLSVMSIADIDTALKGKLDSTKEYKGEVFTTELKDKLSGIIEGKFESKNDEGAIVAKQNGYVTINKILFELEKYAPVMLDKYSADQKKTIAANLNIYTKDQADTAFIIPSKLMDEYLSHLIALGKSSVEAQKILRDKLGAVGNGDLSDFVNKNSLLSDLSIKDEAAKKKICSTLGAAYATDYQPSIADTGWITLTATGLYIRQIGNIVCIQGETTASWGNNSTVFEIPNQVQPPKYSVQFCQPQTGKYDYDRNLIVRIEGNSRKCFVVDNGIGGSRIALTITYMI